MLGGSEEQRNVWEERRMSGGFSHFLQSCALKVGHRERERDSMSLATIRDYR